MLDAHIEELLWSLWTEMGISGWSRNHEDWCLDPEPLLLFTASCADISPRIREESMAWAVEHFKLLSASRLKNLLKETPLMKAGIEKEIPQEYLATIRLHTHLKLPTEVSGKRLNRLKRNPSLHLSRPSMLSFRLRSIFGVGARAEVLKLFLLDPYTDFSAAHLVDESVGFSKRAIQNLLEELTEANFLSRRVRSNTQIYRLNKIQELSALTDFEPLRSPQWLYLFEAIVGLRSIQLKKRPSKPVDVLLLREKAKEIEAAIKRAGVRPIPFKASRGQFWEAFYDWALEFLSDLSQGDFPGLRELRLSGLTA